MFDVSSLSKLTDAIPEDVKEKVRKAVKQQFTGNPAELKTNTMAKPGLTNPASRLPRWQQHPPRQSPKIKPMRDETSEPEMGGAEPLESSESEEDETDAA